MKNFNNTYKTHFHTPNNENNRIPTTGQYTPLDTSFDNLSIINRSSINNQYAPLDTAFNRFKVSNSKYDQLSR
jgi:hypothetical protein